MTIAAIFDMFELPFMVQAFLAAILSGIILSYLGVHVVRRGIVFVDLALGQISSLGVAFALFIGAGVTTIPVLFTLVGALLMSFINIRDKRLNLEAIIGIVYAISSAATVMLISKTPHGDSDIQEVLFGNILSVSQDQIMSMSLVFSSIFLLHIIFFKKFFELTIAIGDKSHVISTFNIFNFLFYLTIGLAIVFAVRVNGVIPVFSFLIIPAVSAMLLTKNSKAVIVVSMFLSLLAAFLGLDLSFHSDFPAGSSIVAMLGVIFIISALYNVIVNRLIKR